MTRQGAAGDPPPTLDGRGLRGWCLLALTLAAGALLVGTNPAARALLDWQPGLAWTEPWRWWSAAWVHYSRLHWLANLGGVALVAALGWAAGVGRDAVIAWGLAWPLTHLALLLQPALLHYGGLSGVLHAGVATVSVLLWRDGSQPQRRVGLLLLAGLGVKLASEAAWMGPLREVPGWDITIAPFSHVAGVAAGALCALLLLVLRRSRRR